MTEQPAHLQPADLIPDALGGARSTLAGLVRAGRPLFRQNPSLAVNTLIAPLAAIEMSSGVADDGEKQRLVAHLSAGGRVGIPLALLADGAVLLAASDAPLRVMPSADGLHVASGAETPERVATVGLCDTAFSTIECGSSLPNLDLMLTPTRVATAALAVSAVDAALQLALSYATSRELYRATVLDIPHARGLLAQAHTDLLVADLLAGAAVASVDAGSPERSIAEAAIYLVPLLLGDAMRTLSVLFGSSFYARVEPYEQFESTLRDVGALSLLGLGAPPEHGSDDALAATLDLCLAHAETFEQTVPSQWGDAATVTIDARVTGRREALSAGVIESAIDDLEMCVRDGISTTFDRVPLTTMKDE